MCEQPFARKTERRLVCGRAKCRHEIQRHREQFSGTPGSRYLLGLNGSRSAHFTGLKTGQKSGRPFRIVAGPIPAGINLRVPLDPELAARLARAHTGHFENLKKAKRRAARVALIKRKQPPVNVLGGYKFPGAPEINLSPTEAPGWAVSSRWIRSGAGAAGAPDIPEFLRRATAPTPRLAEQEAT